MLTCNKTDKMVVDAPNSNGPFQPVALMHFRGTYGRIILPVRPSDTERESGAVCSSAPVPLHCQSGSLSAFLRLFISEFLETAVLHSNSERCCCVLL